jgi:two-component system response regulator YesN
MYKLFVVDDEKLERKAIRYIIEKNKISISQIIEIENGIDAVEKAKIHMPDIIIMDIKIPGLNGIEASERIKKFDPSCKIIFLTAFDYFDYAQKAIRIGAEDFIIKPTIEEDIVKVLNNVIDIKNEELKNTTKYEEMLNKMYNYKKFFKNEFLSSLIMGTIKEEVLENYLKELNVKFCTAICGVIKLIYDSYPIPITEDIHKKYIKEVYSSN